MNKVPCDVVTVATSLAAASVLLLAGCSASPGASGTTAGVAHTDGASPVSPSAAASAAPGGPLTGDGLCALVSVAQAQAALAVSPSVTDQESGTFVDDEPECGYASGDQSVIVNVIVFDAAKKPFDSGKFEMAAGTPRAVTVAGHPAGVNDVEVDVSDGDKVLAVENFGSANAGSDGLVALAGLFLAKI